MLTGLRLRLAMAGTAPVEPSAAARDALRLIDALLAVERQHADTDLSRWYIDRLLEIRHALAPETAP